MEKEKNGKGVIILLVIIIAILAVLCVLFATGTISLKTSTTNDNQQTSENKESNEISNSQDNNNSNDNQTLESNKNIYSAVLDEYKNAIQESNKNNTNYKYVNENAINHYFNQKGTEYEFNFKYSFYDINKDGNYEMLINNGIIDIFSYDGNNIIRLFKDNANCLAESRCQINIYDDGTLYFSGSGGASSHHISFYNISKNVSTLNTINSYYLKYGDNGSLTIYDESTYDFSNDTGTKLNYSSDKELLNANIHNANQIDLNDLNWNTIN